jgi:hypothetical protein
MPGMRNFIRGQRAAGTANWEALFFAIAGVLLPTSRKQELMMAQTMRDFVPFCEWSSNASTFSLFQSDSRSGDHP